MRFCSLGSGSTGNATLVESTDRLGRTTRLLIDCGFTQKELSLRLGRLGLAASDLDAIFVTHEHGDHIGCAVAVARRHDVPLWMSRGTWRSIGAPVFDDSPGLLNFSRDLEPWVVGNLEITPYTVPHDAAEPLQLTCSDGHARLGVLTDAGCSTDHLLAALSGCDALVLECNHDRGLLAASSYPASLKARVSGRLGHLANDSAAAILAASRHDKLRHVVAAHLSEQNNLPELASRALADALATEPVDIVVAHARDGFAWLDAG